MKLKIRMFLIFMILLGILSCNKDKIPLKKDCEELPVGTTSIINFYSSGKQYMSPYFNPNNDNEFIYYFRDHALGVTELRKHDLLTEESTILFNLEKIQGQPKWHKNGWVAFTVAPNYVNHIYIVKDNGDSLRQLSDNLYNYSPDWASDGNSVYWCHTPVLGLPYYFLNKNIYTNQEDTILYSVTPHYGYATMNDINNNNELIAKTILNEDGSVSYLNLNKEQLNFIKLLSTTESTYSPSGLCWSENNKSIYLTANTQGLFKINIETKELKKIMSFCWNKYYTEISCSPDGKKLIGERVDSYFEGTKIINNSSIYLIDLETLEETEINLE